MKYIFYTYFFFAALVLIGCGKEINPRDYSGTLPAPAKVTDVKVIPVPGGANITYKNPVDPNFSYAKAVYEIRPGVTAEAKTSIYNDTLKIEGFGNTNLREVKIYSVGKNGSESEPITVKVTPLPPAIATIFPSLKLGETFGGAYVKFQNPDNANLALVVMYDSTGNGAWSEVRTFYSSADSGAYSVRGFDPQSTRFAVSLRDRWGNNSDTLIKTLTPIFEELIPKTTWSNAKLPNDSWQNVNDFFFEKLWDGKYDWNMWASEHTSPLPKYITINLGKKVVLGRMKQWHFPAAPYSGSSMKNFEVWGSNNPNPDGSLDASWIKLGAFESVIRSGNATPTADDIDYVLKQGEEFEFSPGLSQVQYIRFKINASFASNGPIGQVVIGEFTFWGQVK